MDLAWEVADEAGPSATSQVKEEVDTKPTSAQKRKKPRYSSGLPPLSGPDYAIKSTIYAEQRRELHPFEDEKLIRPRGRTSLGVQGKPVKTDFTGVVRGAGVHRKEVSADRSGGEKGHETKNGQRASPPSFREDKGKQRWV
jgi:hypothetical protein